MKAIGDALDRVDGRLKVTGGAPYSAEFQVPGLTHAVMVTSTIANGRVARIDADAARRMPGVLTVMTHENAPRVNAGGKSTPQERVLPILQDDVVLYDRQPVAVVVADTFERATDAADSIRVEYVASDPATTFDRGVAYTPKMLLDTPAIYSRGEADGALERAAVRVDNVYITPVEHHNAMEPHATIAAWEGDHLTLHDATQGIFATQKRAATVFGIPASNVRVISSYIGGGFGSKGSMWPHTALAAMASKLVGRAVKLVVTRPQMFGSVGYRPRTVQRIALGASPDGTLEATIHETTSQTSTFDEFTEPTELLSRSLYAVPNVRTAHTNVRLNVSTPTFMRAPGESSGSFALESAMDELAVSLRIDPLELRLKNYAERDLEENKPYSSKSLRACYLAAAERFGWSKRNPTPRATRDGNELIGVGMATATYPTNRSQASAVARLSGDGSATVQSGSQDLGTGAYTIFTQLSAETLGLPVERVRFELGDTNMPPTPVSGGSQTTASVGSAVFKACNAVVAKTIEMATADRGSPLFGLPPSAIVARDGGLYAKSEPTRGESFAQLLGRNQTTALEAYETSKPEAAEDYSKHAFGAQFAEVRVDADLGIVRVSRMVGAFASGRILNAKTARSQYLGGMIWGISMALHEETRADLRTGRITTANLADYLVPVNADIPAIEVIFVPEDDEYVNPIGVKGIGEIGIVGGAAAIANAVFNATGKRIRELPITPDKLVG
jgi:xanthine dehydrogenase YagR molybdenum-binding subunit